jgi:hypothetical protein
MHVAPMRGPSAPALPIGCPSAGGRCQRSGGMGQPTFIKGAAAPPDADCAI